MAFSELVRDKKTLINHVLVSHKNFVSNLLAKISTIKTIIDDQNICLIVSIHYTM